MMTSVPTVHFGKYTQEDANALKPFAADSAPQWIYVPITLKDGDTLVVDTYLKNQDGSIEHRGTEDKMSLPSVQNTHSPTGETRNFYWKHREVDLEVNGLIKLLGERLSQ